MVDSGLCCCPLLPSKATHKYCVAGRRYDSDFRPRPLCSKANYLLCMVWWSMFIYLVLSYFFTYSLALVRQPAGDTIVVLVLAYPPGHRLALPIDWLAFVVALPEILATPLRELRLVPARSFCHLLCWHWTNHSVMSRMIPHANIWRIMTHPLRYSSGSSRIPRECATPLG